MKETWWKEEKEEEELSRKTKSNTEESKKTYFSTKFVIFRLEHNNYNNMNEVMQSSLTYRIHKKKARCHNTIQTHIETIIATYI